MASTIPLQWFCERTKFSLVLRTAICALVGDFSVRWAEKRKTALLLRKSLLPQREYSGSFARGDEIHFVANSNFFTVLPGFTSSCSSVSSLYLAGSVSFMIGCTGLSAVL